MLKKSVAIFVVGITLTLTLAYVMNKMGLITNIFAAKNSLYNGQSTVVNNTAGAEGETENALTMLDADDDRVPLSTDSGEAVQFSDSDIEKLTEMLSVPYLYAESFENSDGVPASVACHVAVWMAERKSPEETTGLSHGEITIYLFKYFGGAVTDFNESCAFLENTPITYSEESKTFNIEFSEQATHSVEIQKIEYLGNNNYYKVTAMVTAENSSGCEYSALTAVIQKNKLDSTLGFSIKAMQWS
ncbi:MAG: hypothetical protein LUH82_00570 [Clostridiales bacterium]|nr:hypothetical protein [Clostridiales bacterium]